MNVEIINHIDETLAREVSRKTSHDNTRRGMLEIKTQLYEVASDMSTPDVYANFGEYVKRNGRAWVAIILACTLKARERDCGGRYDYFMDEVLDSMRLKVADCCHYAIRDNIDPTRILDYAAAFIRVNTTMEYIRHGA